MTKAERISYLIRSPGAMQILLNAGWIDDLNADYTYSEEQGISNDEFREVEYQLLKNVPSLKPLILNVSINEAPDDYLGILPINEVTDD